MNDIKQVKFNSELILTTEQLSTFYGASPQQIKQNFANNKNKFIKGSHYFELSGEELKQFKSQVENIDLPINKFASHLILWTKRGASRHSKMLGTDQAWDRLRHRYLKVVGQYKWFVWMVNRGGAEMQLN